MKNQSEQPSGLSRVTLRTHLSLVLCLESQPSLDAAPRLQEGLTLSAVRQVTDENPSSVHTHEQHSLSRYLKHTHTHTWGQSTPAAFSVFGLFQRLQTNFTH